MNKFLTHVGNRIPIYLLIVVIGGLMLYYAIGYVPYNESKLDDHGVRVLANKAGAILERFKGYDNSLASAPVSYLSKWYFETNPEKQELYVGDSSSSYVLYASQRTPCTRHKITRLQFDTTARVFPNFDPVEKTPKGVTSRQHKSGGVWRDPRGTAYFVYSPKTKFYEKKTFEAQCTPRMSENDSTHNLNFLLKVSDLTTNLRENDYFEDMFVVRAHACRKCANTTTYDEEVSGFGNYILDESKLGLVEFPIKDTVKNASTGIYQQIIFGKPYKVYYQLVKLRTDVDVYVIGVIPLEGFKSEAKKVSVWFLVFCCIGALLLIFLFPVLKLFLVSQGERLSTNDISFGVFSIMLCACLCMLLTVGYYFFAAIEIERSDKNVKQLAKRVARETDHQVAVFRNALKHAGVFSVDAINRDSFKLASHDIDFNEVFLLDRTHGYMKALYTEKGNIPDLKLFPVNLSDRKYFKAVHEANIDYFIQGINSFVSGEVEIAISTLLRFPGNTESRASTAKKDSIERIGVVTTRLPSILQSGIPSPYQFILLDHNGNVIYHSRWNLRNENFLNELGSNRQLESYIEKGVSAVVDFTHSRQECRAYVTPVAKNWSVLVYYEKSLIYNLSAQIFILCMISLFIVVIFCMALHLLLRFDGHHPVLLKTRSFIYEWLNPNHSVVSTWWKLCLINTLMLLLEAVGMYFLESFVSTLFFSLATIAAAYIINLSILKPTALMRTKVGMAALLLISCVAFFITASGLWFFGIPLLAGPAIAFAGKSNLKQPSKKDYKNVGAREKSFLAYRCFMIALLFLIIIGPSMAFLAKHYKHEKNITTTAALFEDIRFIRNYPHIDNLPADSILYFHTLTSDTTSVKVSADSCDDVYDALYYGQFPTFSSLNSSTYSDIPSMRDIDRSKYGNIISVHARTNDAGMKTENARRHTVAEAFMVCWNRAAMFSLTAFIAILVTLYWVLTKINRKIFYLPRHAAWSTGKSPIAPRGTIQYERSTIRNQKDAFPGIHLPSLEENSLQDKHLEPWQHEQRIIELQRRLEDSYQWLWHKCSDDEKFFLCDLAEDGIANHPDENMIRDLAERKLIRLYPKLEIFNVSFANFIRSNVNAEEATQIDTRENKDGRWGQIRILLIIIILSAFAFLSIAEENFFGRATALIGSITLLLPNMVSLLGSLTKLVSRGGAGG